VPYANGETPVPGDYVKNELQQPGPVTRVSVVSNGDEFVTIRFDRGLDSPLTRAKDFTLISIIEKPRRAATPMKKPVFGLSPRDLVPPWASFRDVLGYAKVRRAKATIRLILSLSFLSSVGADRSGGPRLMSQNPVLDRDGPHVFRKACVLIMVTGSGPAA
jgi:hypothetical protein